MTKADTLPAGKDGEFKPAFVPDSDTPSNGSKDPSLDESTEKKRAQVPGYIRHWDIQRQINIQRLQKGEAPSPRIARESIAAAEAKRRQLPQLQGALESGRPAKGDKLPRSMLYQAQKFLHMLGPDNRLAGAGPDLELVAQRIIENLGQSKEKAGQREGLVMDAAGALMAASRIATGDNRARLREGAREQLDSVIAHREDRGESSVHSSDAHMFKIDLDYDELYDALEAGDASPEDVKKFVNGWLGVHMKGMRQLEAHLRGEGGLKVPDGKAFEWWFLHMERQKRILAPGGLDDLPNVRYMAALPHEDAPHSPMGTHESTSDGRDTVVRRKNEHGIWLPSAHIQLKSHNEDDTRYREPVLVMEVRERSMQSAGRLRQLMTTTTGEMLATLQRKATGNSEEMALAQDITDWERRAK